MSFIPDTPRARVVATACLILSAGAVVWSILSSFEHRHVPRPPLLLYDLERKILAEYPVGTEPGTGRTASLKLFAKAPGYEPAKSGMTLDDLEKAGLRPGWLFRLDDKRQIGLYADPRHPDRWLRSDAPECRAQLDRWIAEAAAFSSTGRPIPCKD